MNSPNAASIRPVWTALLALGAELGMLPKVMYKTANSKKAALKKPVNLETKKDVSEFFDRLFRTYHLLPVGYASGALWAEDDGNDHDYLISFGASVLSATELIADRPYMLILNIPDRFFSKFENVLKILRLELSAKILVFEFNGFKPDTIAISESDGMWIERATRPDEFEAVANKIAKNNK